MIKAHNIRTFSGSVIGENGECAMVLCVTYSLDPAGTHNAAFFGQVGSEFPPLPMPVGRALTFQEELRNLGAASAVFDTGVARQNEVVFLSAKLGEAYGPILRGVTIEPNQ